MRGEFREWQIRQKCLGAGDTQTGGQDCQCRGWQENIEGRDLSVEKGRFQDSESEWEKGGEKDGVCELELFAKLDEWESGILRLPEKE